MKTNDILIEYYDPEKDVLGKASSKNTRRPKLTLKKLNRMRKQKMLKRYEEEQRLKFLPSMYGIAPSI